MRWLAVVAAAALAGASMVSCSQIFDSQPCLPPEFSLSQDTVSPGGSVKVSADDATCDPRYGENAQVQIEIMDGSGAKVMEELAPMRDGGGFSVPLGIPVAAVPGQGTVSAYPYNVDWCDDTGHNNRAASGFERVSCASRAVPLTITEAP